jgi:hypothetical protein
MPIRGYEYQSDFARQYVAEGEARGYARGRAESLLAVYVARGRALTDAQRTRVRDCTETATLDRWVRYAASAEDSEAILEQARRPALEAPRADGRYEHRSELARQLVTEGEARGEARGRKVGEARGEARGRVKSLLAVCAGRRLKLTKAQRARVRECTDTATLERWTRRAVGVEEAAAIFK